MGFPFRVTDLHQAFKVFRKVETRTEADVASLVIQKSKNRVGMSYRAYNVWLQNF